jgi:transcriptional regulator with XRE-family HTH domain
MAVTLHEKFARAVRSARRSKGLSQAEAAERIGIAVEAYGRLERGVVLPRAETLVNMADVFGVTCDALLGLEATPGGALVAREVLTQNGSPELRRVIAQLDGLNASTLRLVAQTIRALRSASVQGRTKS